MNWIALAWAGFLATTFSTAFFWLVRSFDWTEFSPPLMLGCLVISDPRRPIAETLGFLFLVILGSTAVPAIFATAMIPWHGPAWIGGLVVGGFWGLAVAAALPVYGMISACVRGGSVPPPGPFGIAWGRATPAFLFAGSMMYGAIFAAVFSGF